MLLPFFEGVVYMYIIWDYSARRICLFSLIYLLYHLSIWTHGYLVYTLVYNLTLLILLLGWFHLCYWELLKQAPVSLDTLTYP